MIELDLVDNNQPIMDSKDEKIKKRLEYIAKRKIQCDNLCAYIWATSVGSIAFSLSCLRSPTLLLSYSGQVLTADSIALQLSCSGSSTLFLSRSVPTLSSYHMPTLLFLIYTLTARSSLSTCVSYPRTPTILMSCSVLNLAPTYLIFLAPRIFK